MAEPLINNNQLINQAKCVDEHDTGLLNLRSICDIRYQFTLLLIMKNTVYGGFGMIYGSLNMALHQTILYGVSSGLEKCDYVSR